MIRDKNIEWQLERLFFPVTGFNGYSIDILAGATGTGNALADSTGTLVATSIATSADNLIGATAATDKNARQRAIGNGNPRLVPITGLNMQALLCVNAGDGVLFHGMIPDAIDSQQPIQFVPWWTSEAAAVSTRTITWAVTYGLWAPNSGVLVDPTTALDTPVSAQAPAGTSLTIQRATPGVTQGQISQATIKAVNNSVAYWAVKVLMSAFNGAFTENKYLLGLEITYMPNRTIGYGNLFSRKENATLFSDQMTPNT